EDPRAELVRRLLEYQQIRELVEWLGQAAARRAEQLGRGFRPEPPAAPPAPLVIELNDLLAAAERVIALIPEPVLHRVVPRPLDGGGATADGRGAAHARAGGRGGRGARGARRAAGWVRGRGPRRRAGRDRAGVAVPDAARIRRGDRARPVRVAPAPALARRARDPGHHRLPPAGGAVGGGRDPRRRLRRG